MPRPPGRVKQISDTGFPRQKNVLQPIPGSLSRPLGNFFAVGAEFSRSHFTRSAGLRDITSKCDSFRAIDDKIASSACNCQPATGAGLVLCQIKTPRVTLKTTATAIAHLRQGFFQCGTRVTFTPVSMLSRKSLGTGVVANFFVIAASKPTDSSNQCCKIGSLPT